MSSIAKKGSSIKDIHEPIVVDFVKSGRNQAGNSSIERKHDNLRSNILGN